MWSPSRGSARRLIPAHAGKTIPYAVGVAYCRAHPRSRGENSSRVMTSPMVRGSSPLTRGKPESRFQLLSCRRLIPAHAGKTYLRLALMALIRAHPRSRGENVAAGRVRSQEGGSSPLTRGKPWSASARTLTRWLIPAHAGKTGDLLRPFDDRQAHPRSRGENPPYTGVALCRPGSSPLTRGKLPVTTVTKARAGLIPAHAGKTRSGRG